MPPRDYYQILGVKKSADADEIRRAHRTLARKYHPDVNDSEDAAKRFQEIQEAYDVLGDDDARKKYDRVGHSAYSSGAGSNPWGPAGGARWGGGVPKDSNFGSVIEEIFGGGAQRGARARSQPRPGQPVHKDETIPFDLALTGGEHTVRVTRGGSTQTYSVRIPKGVADGAKLRVRGAGRPSQSGGPPGDLILVVRISEHTLLRRDGLDLSIEAPVTVAEATLGAEIELPTPAGRVTLTVPPGTASGSRLRLRGRGVEDDAGRRGDFYAVIKIVPPLAMSDQDAALMKELGGRMPNPRTGRGWS